VRGADNIGPDLSSLPDKRLTLIFLDKFNTKPFYNSVRRIKFKRLGGQKMSSKNLIMKRIIDSLTESCQSREDLKKVILGENKTLSHEALMKRCKRYINTLVGLGLMEERGGKYCWYTYENAFEYHEDYDAKVRHSRDLIPALENVSGIVRGKYSLDVDMERGFNMNQDMLKTYAQEHLLYYPEIWETFEKYEAKRKETEKRIKTFEDELGSRLNSTLNQEPKWSEEGIRLTDNKDIPSIPYLIYDCILNEQVAKSINLKCERGKIWFRGYLVARGKKPKHLKEFIKKEISDRSNIHRVDAIKAYAKESLKIQETIRPKIEELVMKITWGEPLLGKCTGCPKGYFMKK